MSSITTPGAPTPRGVTATLEEEIGEGLRLCEFVLRMRAKNRILVDALTLPLTPGTLEGWRDFVRRDTRRLAREARDNAKRAAALRDATAGAEGLARSPHDYRFLDAQHLDRRARAGKRISRRLIASAASAEFVAGMLRLAGNAAAEEVLTGTADRLGDDDRALVQARVDAMQRLIAEGGRARRSFLRR